MMTLLDPTRALLIGAALVLLAPSPSWANEKLVGDWKLDMSSSEGGRMNFNGIDLSIAIDGDKFIVKWLIHRDEGDEKFDYTYLTNGEPHTVVGPGDNSREVTAKWRSGRLQVKFNVPSADNIEVKETWKIKRGALDLRIVGPNPVTGGAFVIKRTFVRQ